MRVVIDARTILSPKTGDRTYTLNLLRCLPVVDPGTEYVALLDGPLSPDLEPLLDLARLQVIVQPSPRGKLWTALALPRLARSLGADVVHLQYIAPLSLPCPYVCAIQDISFRLFPQWFDLKDRAFMNWLIPRSIRRAAKVIVPSQATADAILLAYRTPAARLAITPLAAGPQFALPPTPEQIQQVRSHYGLGGEYFLFVGTLQPRKNLPRLLEAFARADTGLALVIAGKQGWRQPELKGIIEAVGARNVKLLGYVPDEHLPPLYAGATALLFPSLYEGFGLPILEAMGMGTPVLTSTVSAMPEVAGAAALLVDPRSGEEMAASIARLAADPGLRAELSARGRRRAADFNWEQTARLTAEVCHAAAG